MTHIPTTQRRATPRVHAPESTPGRDGGGATRGDADRAGASRDGATSDGGAAAVFERHRRELHVHCYRMTGSVTDAEDLVQETFLRAWRSLDRFEGRASLRGWLYRIATNACLDALEHSSRRTRAAGDLLAESAAIQPYPDARLPDGATGTVAPDDAVVARETVELGFIAALAHLPHRQRAVLIVRDVLGWTAAETAELLDITVPAANSLLQRARASLRRLAAGARLDWSRPRLPADDEAVLRRYVEAHERGDVDAVVALLRDDVRITMPPEDPCVGAGPATAFFNELLGPDGPGAWRLVPTRANGRPASANYLRRPGDTAFRALSVDVLHAACGQLVEVNCFLGDHLFPAFGLPRTPPGAEAGAPGG